MEFNKLLIGLLALAQAATAQGLNLGGTQVPKDKIIVYLLIGHSNMAGMETVKSDGVTNPRAWKYNWWTDKQWVAAKETPGNLANGLSGRGEGGPGMPFLKLMATTYPQYHFGAVSNASISSTLRGVNEGASGSPLDNDSNRYWKGITLYNEISKAAKEIQANVTLGGVICMLGAVEATRTSEATCRSFSDDLKQMVTDLRTDLGLPNLPFIMGEYEDGAAGTFALTRPWPKIVDEQIKLLPSKLSLSATVNSVGIQMKDDHHYTTDVGQPEFARRLMAVIQAKGWTPGAASALLPGAAAHRVSFRSSWDGTGAMLLAGPGHLWYYPNGKTPAAAQAPRLPGH